jgi:hypothetical protein
MGLAGLTSRMHPVLGGGRILCVQLQGMRHFYGIGSSAEHQVLERRISRTDDPLFYQVCSALKGLPPLDLQIV